MGVRYHAITAFVNDSFVQAKSCANMGANCGTIGTGDGGTISCGSCPADQTCSADNQCSYTVTVNATSSVASVSKAILAELTYASKFGPVLSGTPHVREAGAAPNTVTRTLSLPAGTTLKIHTYAYNGAAFQTTGWNFPGCAEGQAAYCEYPVNQNRTINLNIGAGSCVTSNACNTTVACGKLVADQCRNSLPCFAGCPAPTGTPAALSAAGGYDCGMKVTTNGTSSSYGVWAGCPAGQVCGGGGIANKCGCTPVSQGAACAGRCGSVDNGCGGTWACTGDPLPLETTVRGSVGLLPNSVSPSCLSGENDRTYDVAPAIDGICHATATSTAPPKTSGSSSYSYLGNGMTVRTSCGGAQLECSQQQYAAAGSLIWSATHGVHYYLAVEGLGNRFFDVKVSCSVQEAEGTGVTRTGTTNFNDAAASNGIAVTIPATIGANVSFPTMAAKELYVRYSTPGTTDGKVAFYVNNSNWGTYTFPQTGGSGTYKLKKIPGPFTAGQVAKLQFALSTDATVNIDSVKFIPY
jgi:hypothetical protein